MCQSLQDVKFHSRISVCISVSWALLKPASVAGKMLCQHMGPKIAAVRCAQTFLACDCKASDVAGGLLIVDDVKGYNLLAHCRYRGYHAWAQKF